MLTYAALLLLFNTQTKAFDLPPNLLASMCYVESQHNIHAHHVKDGATDSFGVCQIKLATAKQMGFTGSADQLMKPEVNTYYAAKFLKYQITRYNSVPRGVTAYNKGHSSSDGNSAYYQKITKVLAVGFKLAKNN